MATALKKNINVLKSLLLVIGLVWGLFANVAAAQTNAEASITRPTFSVSSIERQQDLLVENADLSEEQKTAVKENYFTAIKALQDAATNIDISTRLSREIENGPSIIETLRAEIKDLGAAQNTASQFEKRAMTGETLLKLQQDLVVKEGDLRNLRAEINQYEQAKQSLLQRPIREELTTARNRLADITAALQTLGDGTLDIPGRAQKQSLEALQYYRRAQIQALELDISSMSVRQQIIGLRKDRAQLLAQKAGQEVIQIQTLTGQRRLTEAQRIQRETIGVLSAVEKEHPYLVYFAAQNASFSYKLMRIASGTSDAPAAQAETRRIRDTVKRDLDTARQLTELDKINRQSSATLRRLRNQRPSINSVRSKIEATQSDWITATQDRLWAEEQLQQFPVGGFDAAELMKTWRTGFEYPPLTDNEEVILKTLYTARRDLLLEISDAAFDRIGEASELETLQTDLLVNAGELSGLLERKLLWLPSVAAIDFKWPVRAFRGTTQIFSPEKILRAGSTLYDEARSNFVFVLLAIIAVIFILYVRQRLRLEVVETAKLVGRVQKDSYWHTPGVIMQCGIIAAPVPMILLLAGLLFKFSGSPDTFIQSLGQTGIELAGFSWFFLTWREWNRDDSLLGAHYNLPSSIRRGVANQLRWFIPFAGVWIALVTLTQNSREPDIYEGFSLLAFIVTAFALSIFALKIVWAKRAAFEKAFSETSSLWRYRKIIAVLIVGLPILAAILAAAGYYDTARELLSRLFLSAGIFIVTYVAYGLTRRTVVVAQRRLALRQAIERRELSLKARQEKEEAEERGDPPPPPVNYEEIDLETISRQSGQLLNTMMVIGFAVVMWLIWQDLLPALSVFDNVGLWPHTVTGLDGVSIEETVTLWHLMQAMAIVVLTFISARNLPGFLEVFILNRSRFDAGIRYAIISVLGYVIVAIGLVAAFNKLGTDWAQLQWVIAALGVGIGFGLQEIIANFISGLIILFERPVRIGDYVTIGDQSGTVTRIKIRATTLSDLDNREILIPNKELITGRVTNWTLSNSITRLTVKVGIAYGSDTDRAQEIIMAAVEENTKILDTPKPQVLFLGFGDSSLDFQIRVFLRSFEDRFPVSHSLHTDINLALEKAGITIPFPQRDLHIITPQVDG